MTNEEAAVVRAAIDYAAMLRETQRKTLAAIQDIIDHGDVTLTPEMQALIASGREEGHPGQVLLDAVDAYLAMA